MDVSFLEGFSRPPMEFRPAPFTILNDEYPEGRGERQLTKLIEGLAGAGYGGAYLHPRPGLITEYLSPRWFELIRHCIAECKRCGLVPHLYDENSYPSGFAGGHVPALVPEARSRHATFLRGRGRAALPDTSLALHRWEQDHPAEKITREEVDETTEWVAFLLRDMDITGWHGETIYPSLLDPRTTEAFLETTHERYHRELGPLWEDTPSIFTDEPHLPGTGHGPWTPGLHLTPYLLGQFQQRLGYELEVASLFFDDGNFRKVRYDFYDLCHQLWMENWALPLERWCREHGIRLTGHYLEHDWPCPYATPGHVHALAHMDWPGTDMLSTFLLKGHSFFDIQGFEAAPAGREPHGLLILRQAHSVANQLGKERVVNESWGAGGSESAPEDWLRIGRWMIVHGVNLLIPHSTWDTIWGARKADHPQNFAPQSKWFEYLKPINDELARLCWTGAQGECLNRVLVIDSLTTAFCASRKAESSEPAAVSALLNACTESAEASLPSILPIKHDADEFAQILAEAQVDYDLGDEYVMEEFGGASRAGFRVGRRIYNLVVLIPGLKHLRSATLDLLEKFLEQGGKLCALDLENILVDGEESPRWREMAAQYASQIQTSRTAAQLRDAVVQSVPPRLSFGQGESGFGIAHMHRRREDGELILIANSRPETLCCTAELETTRRSLLRLEPETGEVRELKAENTGNGLRFHLEIPGTGVVVLWATDNAPKVEIFKSLPQREVLSQPVELLGVRRSEDNILAIDFCSLEIRGRRYPWEGAMQANHRYWQAHGLDSNGWNNIIQYRDQVVARDRCMPSNSGGIVRYRVDIAEGVNRDLRLVVECAEQWEVSVNDHPVDFSTASRYRDPRFLCVPAGEFLKTGSNEIVLTGRPFSVRQEIAPLYLLGDFSCETSRPGFRLAPSRDLSWGSWKAQGLPFYDAEVVYRVRLPKGARQLSFQREDWGGALILARQDGQEIGRTYGPPWQIELPALKSPHIEIRVVGLPFNLFGPWHDPNHRWGVAGTFMWIGPDLPASPSAGEDYQLLPLGLFRAPEVLG